MPLVGSVVSVVSKRMLTKASEFVGTYLLVVYVTVNLSVALLLAKVDTL